MKSLLKKKGFTLIEILIVVVILGILAALVLPRLLASPERAITAEALNYLGVIRRAQEATAQPATGYVTVAGGPVGGPVATTPAGNAWTGLGLGPLAGTSRFRYACTAGAVNTAPTAGAPGTAGTCTATRDNVAPTNIGNTKANGTITMGISNGFIYGCGGAYTLSPAGSGGTQAATCI